MSLNINNKLMNIERLKKELLKVVNKETRQFVIMQSCIERGLIQRTSVNLNLCSNEKCFNCVQFHESLKKISNEKPL